MNGPKGKNGPIAFCPNCGSINIKWDADSDICNCIDCKWKSSNTNESGDK